MSTAAFTPGGIPVLAGVARVWRALTWRHWAWAVGLGVTVALLVTLQTVHINTKVLHLRVLMQTPWYLGAALVFMVAIGCVEASRGWAGNPAYLRYVAAAAVASALWLGLCYAARDYFWMPPSRTVANDHNPQVRDYRATPKSAIVFTIGFEGIVHGWLATLIYARLRALRIAARALSEAEMDRAVASRDLLDTQLRSAQTTVDPSKLLDELGEIERAYERDPVAADARIDELIAFLRSAIPRLRADDLAVPAHAQGDRR